MAGSIVVLQAGVTVAVTQGVTRVDIKQAEVKVVQVTVSNHFHTVMPAIPL